MNEQVIPDKNEDVNIGNKIDVEGEEIGASKQRRLCLESLKSIQNNLYNVDDNIILSLARQRLSEVAKMLDENVPTLAHLPLWIKRGRKGISKSRTGLKTSASRKKATTQSTNSDKTETYVNVQPTNEYLKGNSVCRLAILLIFYTPPHSSGGVLWFHVGRPCVSPSVCPFFVSG